MKNIILLSLLLYWSCGIEQTTAKIPRYANEYRFPQWVSDYDFAKDSLHRLGDYSRDGTLDTVTGFYFMPSSINEINNEHDPRFLNDDDEEQYHLDSIKSWRYNNYQTERE
jgi:hypothetical protein